MRCAVVAVLFGASAPAASELASDRSTRCYPRGSRLSPA